MIPVPVQEPLTQVVLGLTFLYFSERNLRDQSVSLERLLGHHLGAEPVLQAGPRY